MLLNIAQFGHRFDHVHWNANRSSMIGNRASDRLTNPPCRICRKLVATLVLILIHSTHEPCIAFLDNVQEWQSTIAILLCDGNNQSQISARKCSLCQLMFDENLTDSTNAFGKITRRFEHKVLKSCEFFTLHLSVFDVISLWILLRSFDESCQFNALAID